MLTCGDYADLGERLIGVQAAEESIGACEVVDDLDAGRIAVAVAGGGECVDAASVLIVFVRPKVRVRSAGE